MLWIKLIRKLGKLVRGGVTPRQILLGAILGVILGMLPGFSVSTILAVVLLLLLNAHVGIALIGFGIGKVLCHLLAPLTFQIGFVLIHNIGLEGLFRWAADTPVLALCNLHVYCLVGGIPVAIVVGIVLGMVLHRIVTALRIGLIESVAASAAMQKLGQKKLVKIFLWLVFGKQKETIEEMLNKAQPFMRKAGMILVVAVLVITLGMEFLLLDFLFKMGLEKGLTAANGAEVNVASADLSLMGGRVAINGIQITDAGSPEKNMAQAATIEADLSVSELLKGRAVVDLLAVSDVRFGVERATPGKVHKAVDEKDEDKPSDMEVFEKKKTIEKYLRKAKEYLEKQKRQKEAEKGKQKEAMKEKALNEGYLSLSARDFITERPTLVIREVKVEKIQIGQDELLLVGNDVSSHPALHDKEMTLALSHGPKLQPIAELKTGFKTEAKMHTVHLDLDDLPAGKFLKLSEKAPISIEDGRADLTLDGTFNAERIDLNWAVNLKQLQANMQGDDSLLGMDPAVSQEVMNSVKELEVLGDVIGDIDGPDINVNTDKLMESLKEKLAEAGKTAVLNKMNAELDKLQTDMKGKMDDIIKDKVIDKIPGNIKDKLDDDSNKKLDDALKKLPSWGKDKDD
jgi:uncharacterized protein (TIGR03546 family)